MGHQVLSYDLVAVSAFPAAGVALKPSSISWLSRGVIVHSDESHIYLDIMAEDEGASVKVPPVSSFIPNEIAYQLRES